MSAAGFGHAELSGIGSMGGFRLGGLAHELAGL